MAELKPERRTGATASHDGTGPDSSGQPNPASAAWAGKRRSSRVVIDIPVEVYGQSPDGKVFHEETCTLVVNAHGALISLATEIGLQQMVLLVHKTTRNEIECRVAYRKEIKKGRAEVGIEFVSPSPQFWAIAFPAEDWGRVEGKQPTPLPA